MLTNLRSNLDFFCRGTYHPVAYMIYVELFVNIFLKQRQQVVSLAIFYFLAPSTVPGPYTLQVG